MASVCDAKGSSLCSDEVRIVQICLAPRVNFCLPACVTFVFCFLWIGRTKWTSGGQVETKKVKNVRLGFMHQNQTYELVCPFL